MNSPKKSIEDQENELGERILKLSMDAIKRTQHYLQLRRAQNLRVKTEKLTREEKEKEAKK